MKSRVLISIIVSISLTFVLPLNSCSGCSRSGRSKLAKEQKASQNTHSRSTGSSDNKEQKREEPSTTTKPENIIKSQNSVAALFKDLEKGVFMVFALDEDGSGSQGSGFFLNPDGIGITNYHVLQGHNDYSIKTSNGEFYEIIDILESSEPENLDFVIFKINNKGIYFKKQRIAKERTDIGDDVFAIGSPKGLENSLTKGSVSGYRDNYRIQIDATIDHGSSGGPLFNMAGEVIGITTSGIEGSALNFAVDIQAIPYKKYE